MTVGCMVSESTVGVEILHHEVIQLTVYELRFVPVNTSTSVKL